MHLAAASSAPTVGIDVGGTRKGYHLAALFPDNSVQLAATRSPTEAAAWCLDRGAGVVAVDAPCGWSLDGRSREAERALARRGVRAYATPRRDLARLEPGGFHAWMLAGEALYAALQPRFPLWRGPATASPCSFETYPHAITCALAGGIVSAKLKRTARRDELARRGIALPVSASQDEVDATLCALCARLVSGGDHLAFGDLDEGQIIIPRWRDTRATTSQHSPAPALRPMPDQPRPGRYRHYKGQDYEVLGLARHSESLEPLVVYRALYGERGLWVRPAAMWKETVPTPAGPRLRFSPAPDFPKPESESNM